MKVGIIGSGNVGITSAFAIAEKGSAHVLLYDVVEGRAKGKALDLAEAGPLRQYDARIDGTDKFEDLLDSDILVVAAGAPRKTNMRRTDLFDPNFPMIKELARRVAAEYKTSTPPVVVISTEPVDLMTKAFLHWSNLPREKVIGIGGILSGARLKYFIAEELGISTVDIDSMVLGTHSPHMVILERYTRISGLPLSVFMSRDRIVNIFAKTIGAGDLIVQYARVTGSFYTPGAAVGAVVDAVARDTNRISCVSVLMQGEYGLKDVCISAPVRLGKGGVTRFFELQLDEHERKQVADSAAVQYPFLPRILG